MNKRDHAPTHFLVKSLSVIFTTITEKQSLAVKLFFSGSLRQHSHKMFKTKITRVKEKTREREMKKMRSACLLMQEFDVPIH